MAINYNDYLNEATEIYKRQRVKSWVKVARILHKKYKLEIKFESFRRQLLYNVNKGVKKTIKRTVKKTEAKPFVLSAWNFKSGKMLDIDEYCDFYKLPRNDVKSYKLVSHTGTPYYNILFKENIEIANDFTEDFVAEIVQKYAAPAQLPVLKLKNTNYIDRIIYTDAHIGMEPNESGYSLYGGKWAEAELMLQLDQVVNFIVKEQKGNELIIDDLGDYVDGYNGETVRKGHHLSQNMDNQQMFDVGLKFKILLVDALVHYYTKITIHNICEDNHAGPFGYIINSAFKMFIEQKYSNVVVTNQRKFMNHYYVGKHCFVLSHGKDSKNLKFGFKPHLDPKQIEKIDGYLKQNSIFKNADFIEFSKGDSHQMLFDYCTSDDFDYMNYPAFSPSSEWVQTNFKKGRSGFVLQHIDPEENYKIVKPYFFTNTFKKAG